MNILQIQEMYNKITELKEFYKNYGNAFDNYNKVCDSFNNLLTNLENNLSYTKGLMHNNTQTLYKRMLSQDLNSRIDSIKRSILHDEDVENLKKTILSNIGNNIPTLDLFPGNGQFLPHAVSAEPLYVADKFMEICDSAANSIQNEFYQTRRLRKYVVDNYGLLELPNNSFGLVYCFNEFFYADIEYINKWSECVYDLLYNGGKFIFNFMPDDQLWAQEATLKLDFTSIDYKLLINRLLDYGYELDSYKIQPFRSSYIILKKTGTPEPRYKTGGSWAEIIDN